VRKHLELCVTAFDRLADAAVDWIAGRGLVRQASFPKNFSVLRIDATSASISFSSL
jgi:hypothetical protein